LARAARFGQGWVGLWVSPRRFAAACETIERAAASGGRGDINWRHVLQLWSGFGATRERARQRVSTVMHASYQLPFERFERYTPCGRPDDVAAELGPYLEAGCRCFNFVPEAGGLDEAIDAVAQVKRLLTRR
jgi:alkanesulfonate monooxygenase SsuD/methylene tetrahydromethanopterin reductase-like flavin-dependent oxidoreductase (luciferase family)